MNSVPLIFDALGGPARVAAALSVKPSAASEMKRRKSIPVKYWPKLVAACAAEGVEGVNYERLVKIHSEAAQ